MQEVTLPFSLGRWYTNAVYQLLVYSSDNRYRQGNRSQRQYLNMQMVLILAPGDYVTILRGHATIGVKLEHYQ